MPGVLIKYQVCNNSWSQSITNWNLEDANNKLLEWNAFLAFIHADLILTPFVVSHGKVCELKNMISKH